MDANLRFWRAEGQSFFQRFLLWSDALDPLLLLKSTNEIQRTRLLIQNNEKTLSEPIQNNQTKQAFLLSLSSIHPDTDKIIPVLFRPPAFMPITLPLALPLAFMNRYVLKSSLMQLVVRKLLPAPLFGLTSAFTVAMVRSPEFENGIEVMDRNGKVIGVSKKAGEKAVMETALSRGVLFGTTFFLPEVLMYCVQRARFVKNPRALGSVRMFVIMSVLAGMLPASFSMFPQCGEIKRADLEPEILSSTEETEFFYNRGI
ncbi:sideroflexin-4 isoform X3 [Cyanistes caeruleus]|uniref:sideroflexin-4 isoform X3 n=1 Tax=Cyanistes caeruleus TaxID=156563 RepID=UPI000CDB4248|nr:sideroflexin-4 isoform X3 [Cyanistes caeruleus]